jgi:hypothetical protein
VQTLALLVIVLNVVLIDYYLLREEENGNRKRKESEKPYIFVNQKINNQGYAYEVLESLNGLIVDNGSATVGDFKEMLGLDDQIAGSDNNYGWRELLRNVKIISVEDRYLIDFPQPVKLFKRRDLK